MSFDLGVWFEGERPSRAAAAVAGFYAALVAKFPEVEDVGDESSPWSAGLDVDDGCVLMAMQWGRAAEVAPRVVELAGQSGLICFDPQAGVVHVPPALRSADALGLQSCVGLPVSDPDQESVERAVRRLSAENWFVVLESPSGRYVQVGTGARAGAGKWRHCERRSGGPPGTVSGPPADHWVRRIGTMSVRRCGVMGRAASGVASPNTGVCASTSSSRVSIQAPDPAETKA
ncbi:hypothetical protein ACEZCY_13680 [Streptacidiphilus sp. N1-12]|uniref:Uncharacterized protein n=2 Tax=Streptacidiphilus alkalitolerans TaxID=3342712 RepID=A0ABV6WE20_9ACTN